MGTAALWALSLVGLCILPAGVAVAAKGSALMIAPGLWRIVSDIHGPMQQHATLTQEACWNARTGSAQAFIPNVGKTKFTETENTVTNSANHTTVLIHSLQTIPNGTVTQDIKMIFSDGRSMLHRATMTGSGDLKFSATPVLDEHFTQRGRWIAADCPIVLPQATMQTVQQPEMPALQKLQALAQQLKAEDPNPSRK